MDHRERAPGEPGEGSEHDSERRAHRSLDELRATYDTAPVGLCVIDRDLRYVRVNRRLADAHGVPADEHVGRTVREIVPGLADGLEPALRRVLDTGQALLGLEIEGETPKYPDTPRAWIVHLVPLVDPGGHVRGVNLLKEDVTERRAAEEALLERDEQLRTWSERLEQRVAERTAQVRALASELTLAEERERHRLAQVLHEDLQQQLYAIELHTRVLESALGDPERRTRGMQRLHELIRGAIGRTRQMSVGLSPPVLEGEGLAEALVWLAAQFETDHDLQVDVEVDGRIPVPRPEMRVLLFRTVRELLLYCVQATAPPRLAVRLAEDGDEFVVEVRDPGRAFADGADDGAGGGAAALAFAGSAERLALFDATLRMSSAADGGTRATVRVPLRLVRSTDGARWNG